MQVDAVEASVQYISSQYPVHLMPLLALSCSLYSQHLSEPQERSTVEEILGEGTCTYKGRERRKSQQIWEPVSQ